MMAAPSRAIEAARQFLLIVWEGDPPTDRQLSAALDELLAASHAVPEGHGGGEADAPHDDPSYATLGRRFPNYGYYAVSSPADVEHAAPLIGDAIDDLGDLTRDLREVVWLADNIGLDRAHWQFNLLFFHWGRHARELLLYLHDRQFGADAPA